MIDQGRFVADCPACGPVAGISLPAGSGDDATAMCRHCGGDLGRWGSLKRDAIRRSMRLLASGLPDRPKTA